MERLMTTEEVADVLRIDPVTVRRLIMRGELPAYRVAGEYRFTPTDVETFVTSQRVVVNVATSNQLGDKFTDQARKVLAQASEEARRYNHTAIGTEHLVLALMSEGEGLAARVLAQLQVPEEVIRSQIEKRHPQEHDHAATRGMIGLTAQGKAGLEAAVQEARGLGHHYLGTEHLLLGVLRDEEGLGGQVLRQAGMTLDKARALVTHLLSTQ
jgi:excisionase family DNA binding protein